MSYILEALRKAEQERSLGRVPDMRSLQAAPPPSPRRRWTWFGIGFILLLNAVAWVMIAAPWGGRVNLIGGATDAPPGISAETMANPEEEPSIPTQTDSSSLAAPEASTPLVDSQPLSPKPPNMALSSVSTAVVKPLAYAELPVEFRHTLPDLNLDVHVYSEVSGRSFVMINARRYGNGERLAEGPWLETIVENGVVLRYRGQRFLMSVQR